MSDTQVTRPDGPRSLATPGREPAGREPATPRRRGRIRVHGVTVGVLVISLLVTAALALGAAAVRDGNEDRLLLQRTHEAATVVAAAIPRVQVPLTVAAALAETTGAQPDAFRQVVSSSVGPDGPFVSASIWDLRAPTPVPLTTVGVPSELQGRPATEIRAFLQSTVGKTAVSIRDILASQPRRLGYALTVPSADARYVVYAEAALPKNRRARVASNSAFADLGYSLYLGRSENPRRLLASSTGEPTPRDVRRASDIAPFGDSSILLVVTPTKELGGELLARLPWLLAAGGLAISIAIALLVERLLRQRERAENLAGELEVAAAENSRLYTEQRSIATTLQHSLMPAALPRLPGVETAARYQAGVSGTEVGGDWYDVVVVGSNRLLFSVGDVSGRGLGAATAMATLRFSMRAYALEGDRPEVILDKLGALIDVARDGQFATVICGVFDATTHELTVARAGHLDLLMVDETGARFLEASLGPLIGYGTTDRYEATTVRVPQRGALLACTDGLVERRGEDLDAGMERLRVTAAGAPTGSARTLVDSVVDALAPEGSSDDIAVLALQWN